MPDDDDEVAEPGVLQLLGERADGGVRLGEEAGSGRQVLDRVPAQRHLADREEVGSGRRRLVRGVDDLGRISAQVTEDRVGLGQCQADSGHSYYPNSAVR